MGQQQEQVSFVDKVVYLNRIFGDNENRRSAFLWLIFIYAVCDSLIFILLYRLLKIMVAIPSVNMNWIILACIGLGFTQAVRNKYSLEIYSERKQQKLLGD